MDDCWEGNFSYLGTYQPKTKQEYSAWDSCHVKSLKNSLDCKQPLEVASSASCLKQVAQGLVLVFSRMETLQPVWASVQCLMTQLTRENFHMANWHFLCGFCPLFLVMLPYISRNLGQSFLSPVVRDLSRC